MLIFGFGASVVLTCVLVRSAGNFQWNVEPPAEFGYGETEYVMKVNALAPANITLPVEIAGTTLRAEKLIYYEGNYMEDDSNEEVVNVAGLQVRNYGSEMIDFAEVILRRGTMVMHFQFECIPPGDAVVALERDKQRCAYFNFTSCTGCQSKLARRWIKDEAIDKEFLNGNAIQLTNRTGQALEGVKIYYKTCLEGSDISVGGAAYVTEIEKIEPDCTVELTLHHYVNGNSKILGIAEG